MIDTPVIIEAIEGAEHLIAELTNGIVERLKVLLFFVTFERKSGAE